MYNQYAYAWACRPITPVEVIGKGIVIAAGGFAILADQLGWLRPWIQGLIQGLCS